MKLEKVHKHPAIVRFVHWSVVVVCVLNNFFLEAGDPPHRYLGYAAVVLILLRLVWGQILGAIRYQSLSFFSGPKKCYDFVLYYFRFRRYPDWVSVDKPNPAAGVVYLGIWLSIILLAITGVLMGPDFFWGNQYLEGIHEGLSVLLNILVLGHLSGLLLDVCWKKRKIWQAMSF